MTDQTTLVLPEVVPGDILQDSTVQKVINSTVEAGIADAQEIEKYYKDGLEKMFANQNMTLEEFSKVFNQVVDIETAKKEAKEVINNYMENGHTGDITEALKVLDEELHEIHPLFKKIKRTLEGWAWMFSRIKLFFMNLFWQGADTLVTSSLEWIKWRIDSIEEAFGKYEQQLLLNQNTAEDHIPSLWVQIYKTDGMAKALEVVNSKVEHDGTKEFLNTMIAQLHTISWIKKGNLQRFILAARMNGNSQLLLRATQFKVFWVMPSLLALNFVLSTQKKVNEVSDLWDKFMENMVETSKDQLDQNLNSQIEAKEKMIAQLKKITTDIERLENRVTDHKNLLSEAQATLDEYMPIYNEQIKKLDESIFATDISKSDFIQISESIIKTMEEQRKELWENTQNQNEESIEVIEA